MKVTNFDNLQRTFNTLLEINTKGTDTMIMAQCLQMLQQIIKDEAQYINQEAQAVEEE